MTSIVITGASSGLGAALAEEYAGPDVALGLVGRNARRLEEVVARARAKGSDTESALIDVREASKLASFLEAFDDRRPTDIVFVSAAATSVTPAVGAVETFDRASEIIDINLKGAFNTLATLAPRMRSRGRGAIVLFSSLTAFAPPPDSPSYAASKAAILALGLSLRALYKDSGVAVNVVCPGFVDTPMTSSFDSDKPFLIRADAAARRIRRGVRRNHAVIGFPLPLYWLARLSQIAPNALRQSVLLAHRAVQRTGEAHKAPRSVENTALDN